MLVGFFDWLVGFFFRVTSKESKRTRNGFLGFKETEIKAQLAGMKNLC